MSYNVLHINSYLKDRTFYKGMFEAMIHEGIGTLVYAPVPYKDRGKADTVGEYVRVEECYHSFERFLFHAKQYKALRCAEQIYDMSSVSVIHAHSMCTNGYIAYKLSRKYKVPYIITVRNGDLNDIYKKLIYLRPLFNEIIKKSSKVVFLSESYKDDVINNCVPDDLKEDLRAKSIVIPNGIDTFWYDNEFNGEKKTHKPLRLIYAGEINQNKNISTLINVAKALNESGFQTHVEVVGEIKDPSLNNLFSSEYVVHIPKVNKEELINRYRENDIFIMISKREAFGLVYAEAMTQGLPVIYTKNQGFDKQFEEGYVGFHVDCMDVDEIKNRVKEIVENYKELSRNAIEAADKFRWNKIVLYYINIYREIIQGAHS